MRFLYFGDKHYRLTAPENRLDDYRETMRRKTMEIIDIGKKYKVSGYIQPGDFFDTPNPPLDYVAEVMKMWSGVDTFDLLTKLITGLPWEKEQVLEQLKNFIPLIGVAGNHELFGNNIKTLPKTMIGFISQLGLMKFATKENPYFFHTEDGLKIAITGTHYHLDIDKPEHVNDYVVEEKLGDIHIHIVHGYLTDKSKGNLFRHTLIDQVKHTKADLTITGHDHLGFPITEIDGKYFVNPGAIPRLSNDLKEMNRQVKVLLIDITKEHGLRLKEIPLKTAISGSAVLSRTKINEKKEKDIRIEEFKKTIRDAGVKKATDITEIVRDIADNRKLPILVKDQAMLRLAEKMALMKPPTDGLVKDAYVTKVILENFQSHEYTELEFSKGFNVLVGESKQGKTAVLRALDWIYENKPSGKRIIRKGAEYAKVTVHLSNGYIISRYIEAKRSGKNGYEITDPNTGEVEFGNTKILPEVQKLLGFNLLQIDKDSKYNLNYLKQGTGWFMIGDNYSAPQKAKMIGGIYGTQYADAVIRDLDSLTKRSNEQMKASNKVLEKAESELKKFDYLEDLGNSIQFIEAKLQEIEDLKRKKEQIQNLLAKRQKITAEIEENEKTLEAIKYVDEANRILLNAKLELHKRTELEKMLEKYKNTSKRLNELYKTLDCVKNLDNAQESFVQLKNMLNRKESLESVMSKYNMLTKSLAEEELIISKTNDVERAKRHVESLYKGLGIRNSIEQNLLRHVTIVQSISKENEVLEKTMFVDKAKILFKEIEEQYQRRKDYVVKLQRATELEAKRASNRKALDGIEKTLRYTKNIESARDMLEAVRTDLIKSDNIQQLLKKHNSLSEDISKENEIVKISENKMGEDIKEYQDVLEHAGKCPVCFGTVDKATINRIVNEITKEDYQKGA